MVSVLIGVGYSTVRVVAGIVLRETEKVRWRKVDRSYRGKGEGGGTMMSIWGRKKGK